MPKIKKLGIDLINKIAAGQVVTNPASIVKELVDNSIDAHAKNVVVEVKKGGKDMIKVIDDGEGILNSDLPKSFLPHTTSKIKKLSDLENIESLGFRGEALASICEVAKVRIRSCSSEEDVGRELVISEGEIIEDTNVGMPQGTLVEVSALFDNVPARKKFLRSDTKESNDVTDLLLPFILSHPHVGFKYYKDSHLVFSPVTTTEDLSERLDLLFGPTIASSLFCFEKELPEVSIRGYLSYPQVSFVNKSKQFIFINSRNIVYPRIQKLVLNTYGNLIEPGKYPPFVLFINVPPEKVDPNVDPKKSSVNLFEEDFVLEKIARILEGVLSEKDLTFISSRETAEPNKKVFKDNMFISLRESVEKWFPVDKSTDVIQLDKTFIIAPVKEGLLILDQHSAHESILYFQYLEYLKENSTLGEPYIYDVPKTFSVSVSDYETFKQNLPLLNNLGFDVKEFGEYSFRVESVPAFYKDYDIYELLTDLIDDLDVSLNKTIPVDLRTKKIISFLACRGAIKAGEVLDKKTMINLINKVMESNEAYTCPHGRPAKILLKTKDLVKLFKRH